MAAWCRTCRMSACTHRRNWRCSSNCFARKSPTGRSPRKPTFCLWATASWVPDFRLVQKGSDKTVYLDVLGFWRRSSVEKHLQRLRHDHATVPYLLAVSDSLHIDESLEGLLAGIHRFRQMPLPDEIVRLADELVKELNQPRRPRAAKNTQENGKSASRIAFSAIRTF